MDAPRWAAGAGVIPPDVIALIEEWVRMGKTGQLQLHFDDGRIEKVGELTTRRVPRPTR